MLLLLSGCSDGQNAAEPPQTAPAPSETPSPTGGTSSPTEGIERCPNPEGGLQNTCIGKLDPGTHRTQTFQPGLRYTVTRGWSNFEDLRGNFLLVPPGGSLAGVNPGTSDYIGVYTWVVAPGRCTGEPAADVSPTFDGMVDWLRSDRSVDLSNVHDVSVGGLKGVVMDIRIKDASKGDGCPDGAYADIYVGHYPSDLVHGVIGNYLVRAYFLRHGRGALVIEVADAPRGSDYEDWPQAAGRIISSFRFDSA